MGCTDKTKVEVQQKEAHDLDIGGETLAGNGSGGHTLLLAIYHWKWRL